MTRLADRPTQHERLHRLETAVLEAFDSVHEAHRQYGNPSTQFEAALARRGALIDAYVIVAGEDDREAVSEEFHERWIASIT